MKLLTVLQNRTLSKVGSSKIVPFDVRVISATNQDVYQMAEDGTFRQDLLYRVNTVEIELPPLRERTGDVKHLTRHFLNQYSEKYQKTGLEIDDKAMRTLSDYPWPGNIRELQHAVERAVIMSTTRSLRSEDFLMPSKRKISSTSSLKVEDVEKHTIERAISKFDGNLSKAANELGIGRTTLYRKMKKYNLD